MNTLHQAAQEYLSMRRHFGFKDGSRSRWILDFVKFMQCRRASYITSDLAVEWAQQPKNVKPSNWAKRMSAVRMFAHYRSATDPRTQIPDKRLLPFSTERAQPYLYSDKEVKELLAAALNMRCYYERTALRPWTFHCLLGLLSVSGIRIGEALNLELQDIDLNSRLLMVRGAKFGKDRLVPLHETTCKVMEEYLRRRNAHWSGYVVKPYVFVSSRGNRMSLSDVYNTFHALSRKVGLRGFADSHGPRLHDLRHRFATNTLVGWYRSGQDPQRLLPILSAYLGHVRVEDTQWYLNGSPELMIEAMQRLERCWENRT